MNLADYPDVGRVKQVAAVLDCDQRTVYSLIKNGRLDAVSLGRNLRVTRYALLRYLRVTTDDDTVDTPKLRLVESGDG